MPIAMHAADAPLVEKGRQPDKTCRSLLIKVVLWLASLSHRGESMDDFQRFTPDILVDEGQDLRVSGLDARILHLPGHTQGSIGVLTAEGDLFAGDTLMDVKKGFLLAGWAENHDDLRASVERLMALHNRTVYPGHLKPFPMERFLQKNL